MTEKLRDAALATVAVLTVTGVLPAIVASTLLAALGWC